MRETFKKKKKTWAHDLNTLYNPIIQIMRPQRVSTQALLQ